MALLLVHGGAGIGAQAASLGDPPRRTVGDVGMESATSGVIAERQRQVLVAGTLLAVLAGGLLIALVRSRRQLGSLRHALASALAERNPVLATLPDMVWLKDTQGVYLSCNPAFERLFNKPQDRIVGCTDYDFVDTRLARRWRQADKAAIEAGRAIDSDEWVTYAADGHSALLLITRLPMYDDNGRLLGVLAIGRDISDRHRAEVEARKRESYQRALLDNFPFVVWLKDTEGRFLAVNRVFAEAAGAGSPDALVHKTDFDIWPSELANAYRADDRSVMTTRRRKEVEEQIDEQGSRKWVETYKAPVLDEGGKLLGTVGFARDISERRSIEQALRDSEERFRSFFENNSSVMLLIEPDTGLISEANRAAADFYGYSQVELTNMLISEINTMPAEQIALACREAVQQQRNCFQFQHRLANGELCDVEVHSTPIRVGEHDLLFSIVHDVTERKSAEDALRRERDLFSSGPVVVFTWANADGWPVKQVSSNVRTVLGYRANEMIRESFHFADLIHPDDAARIASEAQAHFRRGEDRFEQSYRLLHKDGHYAWHRDYKRVERDADGHIEQIRGYLVDQSELKAMELSLVDQRRRMENVIAGTRVGTWEWNVQSGEVHFNERWADIIGYRLAELAPLSIETWSRFAHPDDLQRSARLLERHFSGESDHYEIEARMRHRDGHWVWVLDRGRVFEWTEDGKPLWMYGTHQEISDRKQTELALLESERRLKTAVRTAYDLIYEWDVASNRLEWFGDVDGFLGYPNGAIERTVDAWFALVHPEDQPMLRQMALVHKSSTEPYEYLYRVRHKDGSYRHFLDKATPQVDDSGRLHRWVGVCTDITERRLAEERQRLASTVFKFAHEGILITDTDARVVDVNAAFTAITGYTREEALGRNPHFLSSGRQDEAFYREMWRQLNETGHWQGEIWNRRKNGEPYAEMLAISAVRDDAGAVKNYVALFSDITAQKEHQDQLEQIAYYDQLTGLPNRLLLGDRLHRAMAHAQRHGTLLAVVYLDLDGFKQINDEFGHDTGDRLLIDVATRLKQALREEDTVARLGGDEFVGVLTDIEDSGACVELLPRLLNAAAQPLHVYGRQVTVSASLGVTLYPQTEGVDADQLLRQADQAMYQAKLAGKNRYHFFDAEQDRNIRGQVEILEQVQLALQAGEFELYYQPKVNMRSGEVLGAEALLRWPLQQGGMRLPGEFLPFVENHPLVIQIDEWVIDQALRQLAAWVREGLDYTISVNVSAYHLQRADFIERLRLLLDRHPTVEPSRLIVEVLETTALMDLTRVSEVIRSGQAIGVTFALDDFGTGYSSLNYLKNLPARELKIDRSFVRDMLDDRDDLAILEGIMGLATAFSRRPVAEGVESVEHGEMLLQLGCEVAQGFGIGRPMPADQFMTWAKRWQPDPVWREQQRISREDLPVMFAMVEHRAWVKAVESQLNGKRLALPPLHERQCNFGRWLNTQGQQRYAERPELAQLNALHTQVHATAPQLLQLHSEGRATAAKAKLVELHQLRDELLGQLKSLLRTH